MTISTVRLTKKNALQLSLISKKTFYNTFAGTCKEEDIHNGLIIENSLKIVNPFN